MTRTIDLASKNALTGSLLASQARQPIVERPPISINRIWICRCTHLCFRKTDGLHSEGLHISDHPILSEATPYLCVRKSGGYCLRTYISRAADFACGSPLISVIMKKSGAYFLGSYTSRATDFTRGCHRFYPRQHTQPFRDRIIL